MLSFWLFMGCQPGYVQFDTVESADVVLRNAKSLQIQMHWRLQKFSFQSPVTSPEKPYVKQDLENDLMLRLQPFTEMAANSVVELVTLSLSLVTCCWLLLDHVFTMSFKAIRTFTPFHRWSASIRMAKQENTSWDSALSLVLSQWGWTGLVFSHSYYPYLS